MLLCGMNSVDAPYDFLDGAIASLNELYNFCRGSLRPGLGNHRSIATNYCKNDLDARSHPPVSLARQSFMFSLATPSEAKG